jgi:hypothetical protein
MSPGSSGTSSALLVLLLAALLLLVALSPVPLNHDSALLLQCAQLLLKGNLPYVDFVELNPPMALYLHTIPAFIANVTGVSVIDIFQYLVAGYGLLSSLLLFLVIKRTGAFETPTQRLLLISAWILFSILVYASGSFGQREHLFVLACIPWLVLRAARTSAISFGRTVPWIIGILTGLTSSLKPHFLVILLAAELWLALRAKKFAYGNEIAIVCGIVFIYCAHFLWVPQSMRVALISRWIPFITSHYHVYDSPWKRVLFLDSIQRTLIPAGILTAFAAIIIAGRSLTELQRKLAQCLAAAAFAGVCTYIFQQKPWFYHMIPFFAITGMGIALIGIGINRNRAILGSIALGLTCLCLIFVVRRALNLSDDKRDYIDPLVSFIRHETAPTDRITFIATNVYPTYPTAIYADRLPGTRYPVAFPIAMLYDAASSDSARYHTWSSADPEEKRFLMELGKDVVTKEPHLIFIDTSECQGCPPLFKISEYLEFIGWKKGFLEKYDKLEPIQQFEVYRRHVGEREEREYANR